MLYLEEKKILKHILHVASSFKKKMLKRILHVAYKLIYKKITATFKRQIHLSTELKNHQKSAKNACQLKW